MPQGSRGIFDTVAGNDLTSVSEGGRVAEPHPRPARRNLRRRRLGRWRPSGLRGVVNDAVAVYFRDPTVGAAFVARWRAVRTP